MQGPRARPARPRGRAPPSSTQPLRPPLRSAGDGSEQNQKEREYNQSRGPNRYRMRGTLFLKWCPWLHAARPPSQSLKRLRQRQPDPVAQPRRTAAPNLIMNHGARVPPAEVRQHDRFVFETLRKRGDVVEMDVPVLRRALFMPRRDER